MREREEIDKDKGENDVSAVTIDTAQIRQDLAYAMYRYGEIMLFDVKDTTQGLGSMADIVSNFEETTVAPQAAYVLYVNTLDRSDQAAFWHSIIMEKYSETTYGFLLNDRGTDTGDTEIESLLDRASEQVPHNPRRALDIFREIREQFYTEQSSFAIAYIYDEYLAQLDSAISAYDEYLSLYPAGIFSGNAQRRLDFLRRIKAGESILPIDAMPESDEEAAPAAASETPAADLHTRIKSGQAEPPPLEGMTPPESEEVNP